MPTKALAGLIAGAAAAVLGLYHLIFVGPRFRALARAVERDGGAETLERMRDSLAYFSRRTEGRLTELERVARREVHRVGLIRYSSFDDAEPDSSFTLALLNDEGDGVLLTSIRSGDANYTFGKPVQKFVPRQGASKEEQAAIAMARASTSR